MKIKLFFVFLLAILMLNCESGGDDVTAIAPRITLTQSEIIIDTYESSLSKLQFRSDREWKASLLDKEASNWISISPTSGEAGECEVLVSVTENISTQSRRSSINLSSGDISKSVSVSQIGANDILLIDRDKDNVKADSGAVKLNITSNGDWSATESLDWVTLSKSQGSGDTQLVVSYDENSKYEQRSGVITITQGEIEHTFTLTQAAKIFVDAMTISPSTKSVSDAEGTTTISITSNGDWSATESLDWVTLSKSQGSGDTQLVVSYDENSKYEQRLGVITITQGEIEHTFTLTQAAKIFVDTMTISPSTKSVSDAEGTTTISITSNGDWSATESLDWVTLSKSQGSGDTQLVVSYDENITTKQRVGVITLKQGGISRTFTITQTGAESYITTSTPSKNIAEQSGSTTMAIESNDSWSASSNANWVSLSPTSGSGDKSISVSYGENSSAAEREATLTVKTLNNKQATMSLKQSGAEPTISLNKSILSLSSSSNSNVSLNVTTNSAKWNLVDVANLPDWITLSATSGTQSGTTYISVAANPNAKERRYILTFQAGENTADLEVVQNPASSTISIDKTTQSVGAKEESFNVAVTTNQAGWYVSSLPDWATATPESGDVDQSVTITCKENLSTSSRLDYIYFYTKDGNRYKQINVTQSGQYILTVSEEDLNFKGVEGSQTFEVDANTSWSASDDQSWLSISSTYGYSGKTTITARIQANTNSSDRTGTITITMGSGENKVTRTIAVTQYVQPTVSLSAESLTAPFRSSSYEVTVSSNSQWSITSDKSWCTVSPSGGDEDGRFTITLPKSSDKNSRTATLTIKAGNDTQGYTTKTITITQAAESDFSINDWVIGGEYGGTAN